VRDVPGPDREQYFLHYKMQENFGWVKVARHTRAEPIDEMRHAETLADRILFLEGRPNFQRLFPLRLGLVSSLGEPLYLAQLVEQPDD
jgi:bacterioferritin